MKKSNLKKEFKKTLQSQNAITLIALVVTIIILLILAGITLNLALDDDGIIKKAIDVSKKYKESEESELNELADFENSLSDILNGNYNEEIVEEQKDLHIGDTVTYIPKDAEYTWQLEYCSSGDETTIPSWIPMPNTIPTSDVVLSNTNVDYKITEWKIFDIDEKTQKVTLISATPTKGTVYLGGAQGYNNGVKLLNDACNKLYGNESAGIKARSINIEDIENKLTEDALSQAHNFIHSSAYSNTKYGNKVTNTLSSNNYPTIYAKEKLSVIDGNEKNNGLGLSEQDILIKRTDEGAEKGVKTATKSIQPYQTFWEGEISSSMFQLVENLGNDIIYNLVFPLGPNDTQYYIASRSINTRDIARECDFDMYVIRNHAMTGFGFYNGTFGYNFYIRPMLELDSKLIQSYVDADESSLFVIQ